MQLASIDGAVGPAAEARIPVTDEGLLRGDGAFEALRLYGGRPFALEDHYARLGRSCAGLRLEADFDPRRAPDRADRAAAAAGRGRPRRHRPLRARAGARRAQDALLRREHARRAP